MSDPREYNRGADAEVQRVTAFLALLRPKQWTKNLLVFAAPLFTGSFTSDSLIPCFLAFAAMCCASSATYAFNDVRDAKRDRAHPRKKHRPVASGKVSEPAGYAISVVLVAVATVLAYRVGQSVVNGIGAYLGLQILYNAGLKRTPIADVFVISIGFVLRAAIGAVAISVPISGWLFFCTAALALMLGFSKRRDEFIRLGDDRSSSRESLAGYTRPVLDLMVTVFAGSAMLSYGVYSIESPTARAHPALAVTTIFVWYGIARYLYLVFSESKVEEPETVLLSDAHILGSVLGFLIVAALVVTDIIQLPILVS